MRLLGRQPTRRPEPVMAARTPTGRGTTRTWRVIALLVAVTLTIAAPATSTQALAPPPVAAESTRHPDGVRLGGATRYETAAAVVRQRARSEIAAGATLRLVSGTGPLLAVAHGGDAVPTLFVPPSGPVPETVRGAYRELRPQRVEVVGTLPTAQVRGVIGEQRFTRAANTAAVAVSWRRALSQAVQGSDDEWSQMPRTAFTSARVLAEAAAAVQLRDHAVVITPSRGPLPPHDTRSGWHYPDPMFMDPVAVVGGRSAITPARRVDLLRGQPKLSDATFEDVAGRDRYATAALVAARAFPDGARSAYLVGGVGEVDAAATVSVADGLVFLVPPCGPLPPAVAAGLRRAAPERVIAVGGRDVLCDELLDAAVAATTVRENTTASAVAVTDSQACLVAGDGGVNCFDLGAWWGANRLSVRAPRALPGQRSPATQVMRGLWSSMCALGRDARLWCWGHPGSDDNTL